MPRARRSPKTAISQSQAGFSALLVIAVGLNAAATLIVEIVAGRLLAPYFGMSLYTWTTVIGVVLSGLTLGHWIGGNLAEKHPLHSQRMIGIAFVAGAVTTLLVLPLIGFISNRLLQHGVPLAGSIAIAGFATFFLPSLFAGLVQPLATTLALELEKRTSGRVIGRMLAAGAAGSILGTFLAGFLLISFLGSAGTIWLVTFINAGLAAIFLFGTDKRIFAGAAALCCAALVPLLGGASPPGFSTPCGYESQYYCIRIETADRYTGRRSNLMVLDHLVHSISDEDDPTHLFSPYMHLADEFARRKFAGESFSAFFIGGGGFTLPRAWAHRDPTPSLTIAEIDPMVTTIAKEKMGFKPGAETTVLTTDARVALATQSVPKQYDIIFGDAFHDIAIPPHLITDEFHGLVRNRLSERGFYALNVIDDPRKPRLLASLVRTLAVKFEHVEAWVAPDDVRRSLRATFLVYASARESVPVSELSASNGEAHRWLRVDIASLHAERNGMMLTDDLAPVDRLLAGLWFYGN